VDVFLLGHSVVYFLTWQVRDLLEDINVLVGVLLMELNSHVARLQKLLGDIQCLQTRANDVTLHMRTASKYELTENMATITALDNDIKTALQRAAVASDQFDIVSGGKQSTVFCYASSYW